VKPAKTNTEREISNRLAAIRAQRGIPASILAQMVGVNRQTIYAIEAGSYVPNTVIGLRLAAALGVSVEDLFSLATPPVDSDSRPREATVLSGEPLENGQAVRLCKVNGKLVATAATSDSLFLPASDAIISGSSNAPGRARIQMYEPDVNLSNRILLAGCDPAMALLARHVQAAGIELVILHQNSSQSLSLLKAGYAHVAGSHLKDDKSGVANVSAVNRMFPSKSAVLVSFAIWQEGLVTAAGNPKHIRELGDLARKDVRFINRDPGSGSRALLDLHLGALSIKPSEISGYSQVEKGHLASASQVKIGAADCCFSTEACARFLGLHFIPIESVRYDFVVRKNHVANPGIQVLLDVISRHSFRRLLAGMGGYDTSVTGSRVH
jgi:molybdate-binding protein/DNA-binding XRE family transcriptional regulator